MILIRFGCTQCDKNVTVEGMSDQHDKLFTTADTAIGDLLPGTWRMAWTSSSTVDVFCSEACMRKVLP